MTFTAGDRVVRVGPHLTVGNRDWGDAECKEGDAGVVVRASSTGNISVRWDHTDKTSAIIPQSLMHEADYAVSADEEAEVIASVIASILKGANHD